MKTVKLSTILLGFWFAFAGCKDKLIVDKCSLSYDNNLYYLLPGNDPILVSPKLDLSARGVFASDPDGLAIDPQKGIIDVRNSAGGQRYLIKFIALDNSRICETQVTISGIAYVPGIYNLSDQQRNTLTPYYNANRENVAPRGDGSRTGYDTGGDLRGSGIAVDPVTGNVDLESTNLNALFRVPQGQTIPDGTEAEWTLTYRLDDQSNAADNQVTVSFLYYEEEARVPEEVRTNIQEQLDQIRSGRISAVKDHRPPNIVVSEQ